MNFLNFLRFSKLGRIQGRRCFAHKSKDLTPAESEDLKKLEVYMRIFDLNAFRTNAILTKHQALLGPRVNMVDVEDSANFLKKQDFTIAELRERPTTVLLNQITIRNRIKVLEECCFQGHQLFFLNRFLLLMNKEIRTLKAFKHIDPKVNIAAHLEKLVDREIKVMPSVGEDISMNELRKIVIGLYLEKRLEMSKENVAMVFEVYSRIKNRSLSSLVRIIDMLENQLKFDRDRIFRNMFLLFACPDNLQRIVERFPEIGGTPIREIIYKRPKLASQSAESIERSIKYIISHGIAEDRIAKSAEVLTLSPETIQERLKQLTKIEEFEVLCGHPRVLRLIFHHNKASTRLEYLKQLKVKCMSLHVLSSTSEIFEKYAREGIDRTKGRDVVYFLAKTFKLEREQVRAILNRHPNWCHVPVITVRAAIEFLQSKGFKKKELIQNLLLLLYPVSRIEEKLIALMEWKEESRETLSLSGVDLSATSNNRLLKLCLYYIENEFHFSGDGVWEKREHDTKDIMQSSLPEFPKSPTNNYRFGRKKVVESAAV